MENHFGVGNVLGTGFRIWFKNLLPFLLITTLIYSPLVIWGVTVVHGELDVEKLGTFSLYSVFLIPLINIFVSTALTYGVVMELQGQRASIGACIATGIVRFLPVLGVALLSALVVAGPIVVGALISPLLILLLFVPAIMLYLMLYVAAQASVLERPGILGALRRSRELTSGHRWGLFGLLLVLGAMNFVLEKGVELVMLPGAADPENFDQTLTRIPAYMYVDLTRAIIVGSLGSVMAAVAYFQLRNEKEGTSASELAQIFE